MIIKNKESLHLKILSGYAILGILVLGIIMAVWYEKRVFEEAEKQESEMLEQRKLANETFRRFIGLFLDNERAILWEHSDMEEYNRKEQRMLDAMIRLRDRYSDSAQILRIDTVMQLLADKKRHIKFLMDAPTTASRIDSLLSRELPELERRTSSHTTIITNRGSEPSAGIEKKKNLFSWLKRRSKKDREENVGNGGTEVRTRTDVQQLHAVRQFGEDIRTALVEQRRLFEVLSDSLEARNRILNRNIFRLINEFESEEMRSVEERHRRVSELREQAFFLICCISSVGLVFAVLLYLTIRHEIRLRHRYQQRLELSDKSNREMLEMRKRIILTLSHDIRGPLNAISGSAELAMGVRDRKRRSVYLENILSSSRHIMRLANSLLDISRLEEAKKTANELPFRLSGLSDRIAEEYTGMANDKGLLFEYRNGAGTDDLIDAIFKYLPCGPMYYDEDTVTDQPMKQIAAELIREKALRCLSDEIPHGIAVTIERMRERTDGSNIIDIDATIVCERDSHKGIIIGKGGEMLKKIGSAARFEIERMMDMQVNLKLWVKVKKEWRDNDLLMKNYGYDEKALKK